MGKSERILARWGREKDAAEMDEGMMVMKTYGCDSPTADEPTAKGWRAQDAGKGNEEEAASFANACFIISIHDSANLCRPGRRRGGGELKVSVAVLTQDQLIQQ